MRVGIDLGTTNSAVAIWRDGEAALIPNALGEFLTPSAVSIDDGGHLLVGRAALERQSSHPRLTATSFKRHMGSRHETKLGKRRLTPEELSSLVLASLIADVKQATGEDVDSAVITVPAYFNDRQRKATRRAGELAGLKVDRLINEPTAAALAFGIHERSDREPFLVFDLGGGTFDVSIVEIFSGIVEVRASAGDNRLGGNDFNDALALMARPRLDPGKTMDGMDALVVREKLNAAAERCRRALGEADRASFDVTIDQQAFTAEITSDEYEQQVAGLITRLRDPVLRALRDSRIRAGELSDIVLVGGATRMPVVRKAIARLFGRFPNHLVHPDHAVALGAAIQSGLLDRGVGLDEVRMTDICPFSLGIEHGYFDQSGHFVSGLFSPILERNTPIPASRSAEYHTVADNQREILVKIYQGEARLVADNVELGAIKVSVPSRPAGEVSIECRFTYDSSGLLEVDVTVPSTGKSHELVIFDQGGSMDQADLAKRRAALAELKVHPREEAENLALLARADRCFEDFLGERREAIGGLINWFRSVVETQDPRAIADARIRIAEDLDQLEAERYL